MNTICIKKFNSFINLCSHSNLIRNVSHPRAFHQFTTYSTQTTSSNARLGKRISALQPLHNRPSCNFSCTTSTNSGNAQSGDPAFGKLCGVGLTVIALACAVDVVIDRIDPGYTRDENGRVSFPKGMDNCKMYHLIQKLIRNEDEEAIIELIQHIKHEEIFSLPWQYSIGKELIDQRKIKLIKTIFPLFDKSTLEKTSFFYDPIKKGDLGLVQTLLESGVQFQDPRKPLEGESFQDKRKFYSDIFLYAISLASTSKASKEVVAYLANYYLKQPDYDINAPLPFDMNFEDKKKLGSNPSSSLPGEYSVLRIYANAFITPAYLAALNNDAETLQFLISLGANCTEKNKRIVGSEHDNMNPLTCSIQKGYRECFNLIIDSKNYDPKARSCPIQNTPLMTAMQLKEYEMARMLIEKGAEVNISNWMGLTPIMESLSQPHLFQTLLAAGANASCVDHHGRNLWHIATQTLDPEQSCKLLDTGHIQELIDATNIFGLTPLFEAVENFKPKAVNALLLRNANVTQKLMCKHLDLYTRQQLGFSYEDEITIHEWAAALLVETRMKATENANNEEWEKRIIAMEEIMTRLRQASPPMTNR